MFVIIVELLLCICFSHVYILSISAGTGNNRRKHGLGSRGLEFFVTSQLFVFFFAGQCQLP